MSLVCLECDRMIEYSTPLHCASGCDKYSAICSECLSKIPDADRHLMCMAALRPDAVTIHSATSTANFNGAYSWFDFECGESLFLIYEEDLRRLLPRIALEHCMEKNDVDENRQS